MSYPPDPWHSSHEPRRFERTDPTGKWIPLDSGEPEPSFGKVVAYSALFALGVYLALWVLFTID